jgi:Subtilase family
MTSEELGPQDTQRDVAFAPQSEGGFAYRPNRVILHAPFTMELDDFKEIVTRWMDANHYAATEIDRDTADKYIWFDVTSTAQPVDIPRLIAELRHDSFQAQPDHVFFAHDLVPNPLGSDPLGSDPLGSDPLGSDPLGSDSRAGGPPWMNPRWARLLWGEPTWTDPSPSPTRASTARPAEKAPVTSIAAKAPTAGALEVFILDTGIAEQQYVPPKLSGLIDPNAPPFLGPGNQEPADNPTDGWLDPFAGHGTFIAGLVELLAPVCVIHVWRIVKPTGEIDETTLASALDAIVAKVANNGPSTLVNLSLGGTTLDDPLMLAQKIRKLQNTGAVVVASAGNDGLSRPQYPACLPQVVGVGALGRFGPARFTNFGPWVRACAPGVELVSRFFDGFKGKAIGMPDPDDFDGWARWSGTSFSAPIVVAALAREMKRANCSASEAVARVIDAPGLMRIPGLGAVINIAP